jgi:hypothetical protein
MTPDIPRPRWALTLAVALSATLALEPVEAIMTAGLAKAGLRLRDRAAAAAAVEFTCHLDPKLLTQPARLICP